ncbi:MAG: hypothetical protein C5B54_00865 [Acidobacteria bacterium]|nr:MAG: hypothetical protein C5B54_00865 [Acidobacteriota bacterium]
MKSGDELYKSTRNTWNEIWQESDVTRELETLSYQRARETRALYTKYLPHHELILEAGCGLGREVICLQDDGYQIVGIDWSQNALHQINEYKRGYRLAGADIHELPFPDGTFSAYLSFGVLEHFEFGPEAALGEANRVLRQDGILVLLIPYPNLIWRLVQLRKQLMREALYKDQFYETTYTVSELRQYLHQTGFEILHQHPVGHSFTLWGMGGPFQHEGYYKTSSFAERLGALCSKVLPWAMCFESLLIGRKKSAIRISGTDPETLEWMDPTSG